MEIALYRPEIPPNTGNISRLAACTGLRLNIIGEPSFSLDEKQVRRAGLDYWDRLDLKRHADWPAFLDYARTRRVPPTTDEPDGSAAHILLISKHGKRNYTDHKYRAGDIFVFGRETTGLPPEIHASVGDAYPDRILRLPMVPECRSLNLSNTVAIVIYEGIRQLGWFRE